MRKYPSWNQEVRWLIETRIYSKASSSSVYTYGGKVEKEDEVLLMVNALAASFRIVHPKLCEITLNSTGQDGDIAAGRAD